MGCGVVHRHQQGMGLEGRGGEQVWAGEKHELRGRAAAVVRKQAWVCCQKNEALIKSVAKNIKAHSIIYTISSNFN